MQFDIELWRALLDCPNGTVLKCSVAWARASSYPFGLGLGSSRGWQKFEEFQYVQIILESSQWLLELRRTSVKFHHNFTTIGLRMLAGHGADMLCFVKKVKVKNNTRKALIEGR